jgi:CBS domain-containing protein
MNVHAVDSPLLKMSLRPPICVPPHATVGEATRAMVENGVGAVAVVEEDVLVGIFTERDLMVKVVDRNLEPSPIRVADFMENAPITIAPDAKRAAALKLMLFHHCRHLPVTDEAGRILGMLSIRHLYRERLRRLEGQLESLVSYMAADGPGG